MSEHRTERDSLGEVRVAVDALWGAQTQRAVENFPLSGARFPRPFLRALGLIKAAVAAANGELGELEAPKAAAIERAAQAVAKGAHDAHFPVDVFQTGSGTSTNMNANEVIARLAGRDLGADVHPNDDVNRGQSSNDVIPTAIHLSAALVVAEELDPALRHLEEALRGRARELDDVVKTGRTHLMDAMPVRMSQELGAWATQVRLGRDRVAAALPRLHGLALGGTAVGTGVNAHPELAKRAIARLAAVTGLPLEPAADRFERIATQDTAVELSGQLKTVAVSLFKITDDLRWMNSGPQSGLAEVRLPALQPGSSIMPGKVNPVIPEAVGMACLQVVGNDAAVAAGGLSGNFQLNTFLPLIARNLLESLKLLAYGARLLADRTIVGLAVDRERLAALVGRNPILVTALNPVIGYARGAEIAKEAMRTGRPVRDVAAERTDLDPEELDRLLDPRGLTE